LIFRIHDFIDIDVLGLNTREKELNTIAMEEKESYTI
jgi:hypothetical protein